MPFKSIAVRGNGSVFTGPFNGCLVSGPTHQTLVHLWLGLVILPPIWDNEQSELISQVWECAQVSTPHVLCGGSLGYWQNVDSTVEAPCFSKLTATSLRQKKANTFQLTNKSAVCCNGALLGLYSLKKELPSKQKKRMKIRIRVTWICDPHTWPKSVTNTCHLELEMRCKVLALYGHQKCSWRPFPHHFVLGVPISPEWPSPCLRSRHSYLYNFESQKDLQLSSYTGSLKLQPTWIQTFVSEHFIILLGVIHNRYTQEQCSEEVKTSKLELVLWQLSQSQNLGHNKHIN